MANSDSSRTCGNCKFFMDVGHIGECRRFPKTEQKFSLHYCGEFSALSIILPIVEIPAAIELEIRKRGRPAKADK